MAEKRLENVSWQPYAEHQRLTEFVIIIDPMFVFLQMRELFVRRL